jgi:hypothetical protein
LGTDSEDNDLPELGGLYCLHDEEDENAAASVDWQSLVSDPEPTANNPALDPTPVRSGDSGDLAPRGWCIHCHVQPVPPHHVLACDACAAANLVRLGLAMAGGAG